MRKRILIGLSVIVFILLVFLVFLFYVNKVPEKESPAKVAIVLDDWGYNLKNIEMLNTVEIPLTLAILPNLAFSDNIASAEHQYANRELILHMPMEPENSSLRLEQDTILDSMESARIRVIIQAALETVPFVAGLSNHMGSKATCNRKVVNVVMEELRLRDMFFLDSVASSETICRQVAMDYGVAFVKRDVFLDNIADKEYISSQFDKLIAVALEKGSAVGIGHDRSLTLEVIREKSGQLEDSNIEFVLISELVERIDSN